MDWYGKGGKEQLGLLRYEAVMKVIFITFKCKEEERPNKYTTQESSPWSWGGSGDAGKCPVVHPTTNPNGLR